MQPSKATRPDFKCFIGKGRYARVTAIARVSIILPFSSLADNYLIEKSALSTRKTRNMHNGHCGSSLLDVPGESAAPLRDWQAAGDTFVP
jgi:hypothetical protein